MCVVDRPAELFCIDFRAEYKLCKLASVGDTRAVSTGCQDSSRVAVFVVFNRCGGETIILLSAYSVMNNLSFLTDAALLSCFNFVRRVFALLLVGKICFQSVFVAMCFFSDSAFVSLLRHAIRIDDVRRVNRL